MINRRKLVTLFGWLFASWIVVSPVPAQQPTAPLGLTWGASAAELQTLGVSLTKTDAGDFGDSYIATSLPKTLSDVETVVLSFGHNDQLWRIAVISREFERDGYGLSVRVRYGELKSTLAKLYGEPKSTERQSSDSFFGSLENFVYSLYQHESVWFSEFRNDTTSIELSIGASGTSDAYWRIIYVDLPGEAKFDAQHEDAEAEAL